MSLAKKSKVNLPKDWIVVNSTTYPDRVYYFNVRTNKSSWTEPTQESNKPKPVTPSQKRKLLSESSKDEIPAGKMRSPTSEFPEIPSERKLLRAKRCLEAPKVQETAQMKEIRRKILEKKMTKAAQNEKQKPRSVASGNRSSSSVSSKSNRSNKSIAQKRGSKLQAGNEAGKNKSASRIEETRESLILANAGTRAGSSRSSSGSQNANLKKNLARKRLDSLNQSLSSERKKIEPAINAKILRRSLSQNRELEKSNVFPDSNAKNQSKAAKSPTEALPSVSQNVESRFNSLRARLTKNRAFPKDRVPDNNAQSSKVVAKAPKTTKASKKAAKKGGKASTVTADHAAQGACASGDQIAAEIQNKEAFWEEMDWEPIEEEKVIFEVQEVRTQLSTDQTPQPNPSDYSINGLELSRVSQNADNRVLYIVVDTNVYLSNLKTVTELLEDSGKINNHYRPVVVVPWTVIQELDYIKDNKSKTKSSHLQRSAKTAVDMLFRYFSSKHPRLKGQTAADAASNRLKYQVESPDDEILQSCLQIRELGYAVVLLSNDKNLCNKAMIHNISTYGRHKSIEDMLSLNRSQVESKQTLETIKNQEEIVDSTEAEASDEIFCEAKAIIKHFLSTIVSKEMENLYGQDWKKYTIVQPPWSVADVLKCTSKHWIAAISDVFLKQAESLVAKLSKMFSDAPKYGQSLKYVDEVLEACHDLVQMVKVKNYQELSEKTQCDLKELIDSCKEKLREIDGKRMRRSQALIQCENNNLNDERRAENAFKYFEQIWTFTNNFCGLSADLTGIPHSITYKRSEPAIPVETINALQPELVFSLNQLIHALRTVLNDEGYLTVDHPALIALYQSMLTYFPNSGELTDHGSLDIVDLLCCIKVKKECLRTGLVQLQELCCQFCRIADFRSAANILLN